MARYSHKDQDWDHETTTYWFSVNGELIGHVEGSPGYDYFIHEDGALVREKEEHLFADLIITNAMRSE